MGRQRRNLTLVRVLWLARAIQGLRCMPKIEGLARELGVHRRTIYRDLAALEEAGWPLPARGMDEYEEA